MDDGIANFTAITGAPAERAAQFLQLCDGNLESAIQLFYESPDLGTSVPTASEPPTAPNKAPSGRRDAPISVESDDEDDDNEVVGQQPLQAAQSQANASMESDEEMARRLQEELYRSGGGASGGGGDAGPDGVRAPIARTTEQLVGPDANWGSDEGGMQAAIAHQMMMRDRARAPGSRPGIFNQRDTSSIWNEASASNDSPGARHQRELAMATGGASDSSSKSNMLAELFRPPFDLMFHGGWDSARDKGKDEEKWLLINIQDPSVFDCQVLNRDIWKNDNIKDTLRENFVFLQFNKGDPRGQEYVSYYFPAHESTDAYPHIAIVDPRTGEQVKVWSGRPVPQAADFLMQLHEFLDRYSLKITAKNPVAKRKAEKKKVDVGRMTEEEMLEMALANSMESKNTGPLDDDPDALTRSDILTRDKGKAAAIDVDSETATPEIAMPDGDTAHGSAKSPFAKISSCNPHQEPPNDPAATTRIQFRHPTGRIVRRFALNDQVRRLYEWLKTEPLEGKEGQAFELVAMGTNLIDSLDMTIADAGLKMGTVMVEFFGGDDE